MIDASDKARVVREAEHKLGSVRHPALARSLANLSLALIPSEASLVFARYTTRATTPNAFIIGTTD